MAKGFKGAAVMDRDLEARKAQELLDQILKEKAEAEARRNSGKKPRADIEDGLNVMMILPSFSQENPSFIRLCLLHYKPFAHVCPRPAPIFDPNDSSKIVYSRAFQSAPGSDNSFRCQQCISGWEAVANYMKENGIKELSSVGYNTKASKFYSSNKPSVQGVFAAVNLTSFFSLEAGKKIPSLNTTLYKEWYEVFMDVVVGKAEAPEDMPEKMKLQAQAGLQVMRVNQILAKELKSVIETKSEEVESETPNEDGTPVNCLDMPEKFLVSVVRTLDPTSKFQTDEGEKNGFSFAVNCFAVPKNSGWTVPDKFYDFIEENPIDIYDIKPKDESLEAKASAYQVLTDDEAIALCLKYGTDIVNGVYVSKDVKADGSGDVEADYESSYSKPQASAPVHQFDDDDDSEDDLAALEAAKKKAERKPSSKK